MENKSFFSTRLFREFRSLSIPIEEMDEEYGFNYNGSHYNIHVVDAMGTFFIYKQMVVCLVYNVHDNVLHHCSNIPKDAFLTALEHHKKGKHVNGIWGHKSSYVYTDLIHIDNKLPIAKVISESLVQLEIIYNKMQDDITHYIME